MFTMLQVKSISWKKYFVTSKYWFFLLKWSNEVNLLRYWRTLFKTDNNSGQCKGAPCSIRR